MPTHAVNYGRKMFDRILSVTVKKGAFRLEEIGVGKMFTDHVHGKTIQVIARSDEGERVKMALGIVGLNHQPARR